MIPQRELRNDVAGVLRRVAQGQRFIVTVRGEPVAELVPLRRPQRFVPSAQVVELLAGRPADPALLDELREADHETAEGGPDRFDRLFGP